MNSKRSKKVNRSKSPGSINAMFHQHLTPNHASGKNKMKVSKKDIIKSPGILNISKISGSSANRMMKSSSVQSLPMIPGNDLKMIKEIFTQAKKYREQHNRQKVPIKVMPKGKSPKKVPRVRSIPRVKLSSTTFNPLTNNIGKFSKRMQIILNRMIISMIF